MVRALRVRKSVACLDTCLDTAEQTTYNEQRRWLDTRHCPHLGQKQDHVIRGLDWNALQLRLCTYISPFRASFTISRLLLQSPQ
jgi:hypothetical protein